MTMPTERMRAVRFGMEMLNETASNAELPLEVRQRAKQVLQRYPSPAELGVLLTREHATLPPEWAAALNDARTFLVDLRRRPDSTEVMRWGVTVTLRHFPDAWEIEHVCRFACLAEWIAPESARHG